MNSDNFYTGKLVEWPDGLYESVPYKTRYYIIKGKMFATGEHPGFPWMTPITWCSEVRNPYKLLTEFTNA